MKAKHMIIIKVAALAAVLFSLPVHSSEKGFRLQAYEMPAELDNSRLEKVAEAFDFENWPKTEVLRVAPHISKALLSNPQLITRESSSYSQVSFAQAIFGKRHLSWGNLEESRDPLPNKLPDDYRSKLVRKLPKDRQSDPRFVNEYLNEHLKKYQNSKRHILAGEMSVDISLAPSSRAAQEYLLVNITDNMLPTEALINTYTSSLKMNGFGDVGFHVKSRASDAVRIIFVRDNVFVDVFARGSLVKEVSDFAVVIDRLVLSQPPLTREQLEKRKPLVLLKSASSTKDVLSYSVSLGIGRAMASVMAFVDGNSVPTEEGKVRLPSGSEKMKVQIILITDDLLAGSFVREALVNK